MLKWVVRGGLGLLALLVLIALIVGAWAGWRFVGSQPRLEGEVRLSGIAAPVQVVRDTHGVAHIFSASDTDAFFALGYTHASERFFQMDTFRRSAQGRPRGGETDLFELMQRSLGKVLRRLGVQRMRGAAS